MRIFYPHKWASSMPAKGCSIQTFVDRVRPLGRYMYLSPRGKLCSALFEKKKLLSSKDALGKICLKLIIWKVKAEDYS